MFNISVLLDVQANLPETSPFFVCPNGFGEHFFSNVYSTLNSNSKRLKRKFHRLFLLIRLITIIDIDSTLKAFPDSLIYVVNQRLSNIFLFCMPKMIQDNTKVMFIISVFISYLLTYIFLKAIEITGL